MDAVFVRDSRSLFRSEPLAKTFYCPTPRQLSKREQKTTLTPTHPHTTHTPHKLHWDVVCVTSSSTASDTILSTSGSSRFNESWPSNSDMDGVRTCPVAVNAEGMAQVKVEEEKGKEVMVKPGTLAKYIERFRSAPPTSRNTRDAPSQPFWWKQSRVTSIEDHVVYPKDNVIPSPRTPQDHSTPDNAKTASYTDPSPRVSANLSQGQAGYSPGQLYGSLESRSQELIDRSSSLLSAGSSASSMPAQKYLNTHYYSQTQETNRKNGNSATRSTLQAPRLCQERLFNDPTQDILSQWRLKRRLEVARREVAIPKIDPFKQPANSNTTVTTHTHKLCPPCNCCERSKPLHDIPPCPDHEKLGKGVCCPGGACGCGPCGACGCGKPVRPGVCLVCSDTSGPDSVGPSVGDMDKPRDNSTNNSCPKFQGNRISNNSASLNRQNTRTEHELMLSNGSRSEPDTSKTPTKSVQGLHSTAGGPTNTLTSEDGSDDIDLSYFSLDFTTDLDHTSSKAAIPPPSSVEPVVSEVVRKHLFGKSIPDPAHTVTPPSQSTPNLVTPPSQSTPHTVTPPSQSTPHTVTPPSQSTPHTVTPPSQDTPHTVGSTLQSQANSTSKRGATYSLSCKTEAIQLSWDCHMDDCLLKLLITKAKLFEGQINNIDRLLSACGDEYAY